MYTHEYLKAYKTWKDFKFHEMINVTVQNSDF